MAGYGQELLLDWSAYARVLLARTRADSGLRLSAEELSTFEDAVLADELLVCPPFRVESRYPAQSAEEFRELSAELDGFRQAPADSRTWSIAEAAQEQLAHAPGVSHRVKFADLLIAAIAAQHGLGVLHYDVDYDTLTRHTTLTFRSRWIAPRGSVD